MNKETLRAIKFTLFSISAGVIQIGTFTLLNELSGLPEHWSYLIALVLSVLWNFTFNRRYTFQSAGNVPKAMVLVALFYCVFTPVSTWVEKTLVGLGWNEYLVTVLNMVCNFVTEYLYDKFVVFRNDTDTPVQLLIWQEGHDLCGELRAQHAFPYRWRIIEEDHHFQREADGHYYRCSRIYRVKTDCEGNELDRGLLLINHSQVMYDPALIPPEQLREELPC